LMYLDMVSILIGSAIPGIFIQTYYGN